MASLSHPRVGMTLEEFLKLPEESPALEFIDGRIEAKVSPQKQHGAIQGELTAHLNQFARPLKLGMAFPELSCTYSGRSIVPDIGFLLNEHIELDDRGYLVNETRLPPTSSWRSSRPSRPSGRLTRSWSTPRRMAVRSAG